MTKVPRKSQGAIWLFGLLVERKTDVLALTAFLLAPIGTSFQAVAFLRGAQVKIYAPDHVVLVFDTYPTGESLFRLAAPISYSNTGAPGYNAVVQRETVSFELNGTLFEQAWQLFQQLERRGNILTIAQAEIAGPTPIRAGSGISHTTAFAPRRLRCAGDITPCDRDQNFISDLQFLSTASQQASLVLEFEAHVLGDLHPISASCSIEVDDRLFLTLLANRWYSAPCWPLEL